MRIQAVIATVGVLLGALGFKHAQNGPDLSTPKSTVLSLLNAYARRDIDGFSKCVDAAVTTDLTKDILIKEAGISGATDKEVIVQIDGDTARVAIEYETSITANAGLSDASISFVDMLTLKKTPSGWLVVPDKLNVGANGSLPLMARPLSLLVAFVGPDPGYRNTYINAKKTAQVTSCISNTKQIALGVLMYVQDYDEILPRSAAAYHSLIMPYIKSEEVFQCALDAKGKISYSMNTNLQNRSLAQIDYPARTVLLYEGHNGVVDYRHEGRAAIAFMDGHAKLMTETEMKSVIWKLPPPPAKKAIVKKKRR